VLSNSHGHEFFDRLRVSIVFDEDRHAVSPCVSVLALVAIGLSARWRRADGRFRSTGSAHAVVRCRYAWLGIASLLRGLSIAGGGRSVRAAGVSETMAMITFGGAVTVVVCTVSWLSDQIRSKGRNDSFPKSSKNMRLISVAMVSLLVILLVSQFVTAHALVESRGLRPTSTLPALAFAGAAGLGAGISLVWLILSRRRPVAQINGARRVVAAVSAVGAAVIAYLSWHFTAIYRVIAMHG
jgi:uncharacterized membrane protein